MKILCRKLRLFSTQARAVSEMNSRRGVLIVFHACLAFSLAFLSMAAIADVSLVSINDSGVKGNGQSTWPDVNQNGQFVAFSTSAGTLRPGSNAQIVVKDMNSGGINLISKAPDGTPGNSPSTRPVTISANGRYVTFSSYASNLVAGDTSSTFDIFWHDQQSGETKMVNVTPDGLRGNGTVAFSAVSGNGQFVAFRSTANDLTDDIVSGYQVYVRDMFANSTVLVSRNANGTPRGGGEPDIDSIGRWVVYRGAPGNEVYAVDSWNCNSSSCAVTQANVNNAGNPVPGHTSVLVPKISGNGNFVTWESNASGFVSNDTNGQADIFVRDLVLEQTSRVSIASDGTQANSFSYTPDISDDGRFVSFTSNASNLSDSDGNGALDVFIHDRLTGETKRASEPNAGGDANSGANYYARISGDGSSIAFSSNSSNLVPEDTDSIEDIYLYPGSSDSDGDGISDEDDICPGGDDNIDSDGDLVPDDCDPCALDADNDADGDGVCGDADVCFGGDDSLDFDLDGTPDFCDACPEDPENDADGDGVCELDDNCEVIWNPDQIDTDGDSYGDACDTDNDNDGVLNDADNCPFTPNAGQEDWDGDGAGDVCDQDVDGDGVIDSEDQCLATNSGDAVNSLGCSIAELCPCEHPDGGSKWKNHGGYTSCVAHASTDFLNAGLITEAQRSEIVSEAGQSECGHKK